MVMEIVVDDVLETHGEFTKYDAHMGDPRARIGVRSTQYEFAASFNFKGDLLDFTMDGGITITPRRQRIEENGTAGEYSVVLNRQPLSDVTVRAEVVRLVDPVGAQVQQLKLPSGTFHEVTFTRDNWNREQLVQVTAVDDSYAEGVHYSVITHSTSSLDPNFNGSQTPFLYGCNITMQVEDNDFAGIQLSRSQIFVGEGGIDDSYDVVLTSIPWHPVIVTIIPLHANQTRAATSQLIFTPNSWNTPQTVVVSAVDDSNSEAEYGGLHNGGKIIHYSESTDFRYHTRRPQCLDIPNCDPQSPNECIHPEVPTSDQIVRVCDLTSDCKFTLGNGACVTAVHSSTDGIPARFGSPPLDPSLRDTKTNDTIPYPVAVKMLLEQAQDGSAFDMRNISSGLSFVRPPADLQGFVLSFLGLLNLEQVQKVGLNPKRTLHSVCAGLARLETHRWAFEEWPRGYVERVLNTVLSMFPTVFDERRAWNCGAGLFRGSGSSIGVTIWDNDPGVTLSHSLLSVSEDASDATATYSIVLNAPPSFTGGSLQPEASLCASLQSDVCGFWDNFTTKAAQMYSSVKEANVSVAIVADSEITVSPSIVTFTTANWFIPQWITVRAVDDDVAEVDAWHQISHRVQNSPFGYTNATAFWFQGTLPRGSSMAGSEMIPFNTIPTVLFAPDHPHINVEVKNIDRAGVQITVNQPNEALLVKEALDTLNWVGDYATSFAFSDISLSGKSGGTGMALKNVLVLGPNATSYMKFHMPYSHEGDSKLIFASAVLRFHQTPFKIFNVSDATENSTTSTSDAQVFTKLYRLRVTVVENGWSSKSVSEAANSSQFPGELKLPGRVTLDATAAVERGRLIEVNVTELIAQLLPTRLSVVSFRIQLLTEFANTTLSTTQVCSSVFERNLRPTMIVGYRFSNLLLSSTASQSSTATPSSNRGVPSAVLAINRDRTADSTTATKSELEPWWESCFNETTKVGQIALFLPESMRSTQLVAISSLQPFGSPRSLKEALAVGCPDACPNSHRLVARGWISIWDLNAGVRCLRIYREGAGVLELTEVEAYEPFVTITATGDGKGVRSRVKTDWSSQQASFSWRIQQSVKRSQEENLALGMSTRQSSTGSDGASAYLAVDGQRAALWSLVAALGGESSSNRFRPGSTRTTLELDPWWEVDLGSVKPISGVKLFPFVGMPGRGFCDSSASASSNSSSKFPTWSGDLYAYSKIDTLLMLQDPFQQNFEVLVSDRPLSGTGSSSSASVVKQTTLSFSCENDVVSVAWTDAFTKGRFVTVRKRGLGILMLNEVEVWRWNPSVTPRYLLLDLYGDGSNRLALSSIQLFPLTDASALSAASERYALPIEYGVHSVSSQLSTSGPGSVRGLMSVGDSNCYTAAKASYHEWIVLDLFKPTQVGLIELDAGILRCGLNVSQVRSISIAAHGASLDGIRSQQATNALVSTPNTCELDEMGNLKSNATELTSCSAFVCSDSACNGQVRASGVNSTLVLSDFSDTVILGMVDFLPLSRLPLSLNEHRTLLLRDDPAALWTFDEYQRVPVLIRSADWTDARWTGAVELASTSDSKTFVLDDAKESSFYSSAVLPQVAMPAFSLEFWITGAELRVDASKAPVNVVTLDSDRVVFAAIGVSSDYPAGFFQVTDAVLRNSCLAVIPGEQFPDTSSQTWHHVVASYDPASAAITLSVTYEDTDSEKTKQESTTATCQLVMGNKARKTLNFGAYTPTGSVTVSGTAGMLSNVAWYLHALSSFEILDHYHDFVTGLSEVRTPSHNSYSVSLRSKPSAPVRVSISAESDCYRFNLCNVSVSPSTVVIEPDRWSKPAQVHVIATYDQLYESTHTTTIQHVAESEPLYQLDIRSTTLDLSANRSSSDGNHTILQAYEAAVGRFYQDLEVNRVLTDANVRRAREQMLKELQLNWSTQQMEYSVLVSAPYNATLQVDNLTVLLIDATVPGVEFSASSLVVSEDGKGNDYQVLLLSEPKGVVKILISVTDTCYRECVPMSRAQCPSRAKPATDSSEDPHVCGDGSTPTKLCNVTVSPDVLYFSNTNWDIAQTVRVVAVDDHLDESDVHLTSIKSVVKSSDPIYDNLYLPTIVVAVEDNDVTDVQYSVKYVALAEKPNGWFNYSTSSYYSLSLATEPWANVTIAMSNEANKSCYRPCGYHFDKLSCGLPRQQSVTSVRLSTNSTREIHHISLLLPRVIAVQRIVTYATHVDQIYKLEVTGGYAPEVQVVTFEFSDAFKLHFGSVEAISGAVGYGRTFRLGASDRGSATTAPLDGFASADAVKSALDSLFQVANAARVSRSVSLEQSRLRWGITFARLLYDNAALPTLSVTLDTPFEGSVTVGQTSACVAPTGSFQLRYGAANALNISVVASASEMEAAISDLDTVYLVSVTRTLHEAAYGFAYTITFKSVETYGTLVANSAGIIAPVTLSAGNSNTVAVVTTELQSPVRINGYFNVEYVSVLNFTNNVTRTQPLPWNASAALVASEISSMNGIGNVSVSRRQLSAEGAMEWTVEFTGNNGQMLPLRVRSLNLTGRDVTIVADTVRSGETLGGAFVVEMGGKFKKTNQSTQRVYWMDVPLRNTTALPYNISAARLQQALVDVNATEVTTVTRVDVDCDAFAVCNGYTWMISYKNSPGDVPPIRVYGNSSLTGADVTLSSTTIANGTYVGGSFSLKLDLFDADKRVWYTGTTWNLPVNVSAIGMDEALEAIPFVRSNREAEFDAGTRLWRGIKFDKGVRVYRDGPYLDGGHTWRLEWAIEDYVRFQDLKITINASLVTQETEPFVVPIEFDLFGAPRCAAIPTSRFQPDRLDPFGLRGWCKYDITTVTIQERFMCNVTVENPWIVFTPENWCVPQRVRLAAVDDFIDEKTIQYGNVTFSNVTHTVFSDDLIYVTLPLDPVLVAVESDDFAEVLVSERSLEVSEDQVLEAKYLLQLKTEPLYDVRIVVFPWLDSNATGCYRVGFCNLTLPVDTFVFTPRDWDMPQTVVVKATDDDLDEFDVHATGISHVSYSDDVKYHKLSIPKINVTVFDNDMSAFNVLKKAVNVTEGGRFDEYQVVLSSEPFANVTANITNVGTVGNFATTTPTQLTFTWRNWNVSQTVRVDAVDDLTEDSKPSSSVLVHTLSSNDTIYASLKNLSSVSVLITDNDFSGLSLSTKVIRVAESNVTVYMYGIRLTTEPWQPVTVLPDTSQGCYLRVLSSERVCNVTALTPRLYFGTSNWSEWQNVSFRAVDDWLVEAPVHVAVIAHSTTSSDPLYQVADYSSRNGSVQVLITDNDVAFVNITLQAPTLAMRTQLHVAEGGFNDTYRIVLNSEPYEDVRLVLRPAIEAIVDLNDNSVVRASQVGLQYGIMSSFLSTSNATKPRDVELVFTALDWSQPRIVTVFAIDDNVTEDVTQYSSITHAISSVDARYNISNSSLGIVSVRVMVSDKEAIPPPVPVSATFDASGAKIQVVFDSSVYHADTMAVRPASEVALNGALYLFTVKNFNCTLVFNFAAAKYSLGTAAACVWLDLKTLRLDLGAGATIAVQDTLQLNECAKMVNQTCVSTNVIRARHTSRAYTQGSVAVLAPGDIVKPTVIVMAPEDAGSCGAWSVDASLSQGNGGRPFAQMFWFILPESFVSASFLGNAAESSAQVKSLYANLSLICAKYTSDWQSGKSSLMLVPATDLSATPDLATVASTMDQLRSACYLRSLAQNATAALAFSLKVDSTLLEVGVGYIVGLDLTNAFGQRSTVAKRVRVRNLPGPAVYVVGKQSVEVSRVGDPVVLQVDSMVSCTDVIGTQVGYVWSVTSATFGSTVYAPVDLSKANVAKDPRVFRFSRAALDAERTYRFQVEAYMLNTTKASNSIAAITVNVTSSALAAVVTGGSRALGERDTLVLNGSSSFDPDLSPSPFAFAWACADMTNPALTTPPLCANGSASTPTTTVPLDLSTRGSVLTLPPFSLQLNRTLRFTLTISKKSATSNATRTSTIASTVWTLQGSVPVVEAFASASKVTSSFRVALTARVKSTYPFVARWAQTQGDLSLPSAFNASATNTSDAFALPLTSLSNVIVKNKLTPGLTYTLRLVATDSNGNQGFGAVTIKVNSPPSSGRCAVTPKVGYAVRDIFTLSCTDWTDDADDLPLKYSFSAIATADFALMVASMNDSIALGAQIRAKGLTLVSDQLLPTATVTMLPPAGLKNNASITVVAFITDALGGFALAFERIEVLLPLEVKSNPLGFVGGLLGSSTNDTGTTNLLSAVSILSGAFKSDPSDVSACTTTDSGVVCAGHGECDPATLTCVCIDAYMGANCDFQVLTVRSINNAVLSSLRDASRVTEASPSGLSQQATILDTVTDAAPAAFDEDGLEKVAALSSSIVGNAFSLQDQDAFLDAAGSALVRSLSTVLAITAGTATTPTTATGTRRLQSAFVSKLSALKVDCSIDQTESSQAQAVLQNTIGTLHALAAIASRESLPEEAAVELSSTRITAISSAGTSATSLVSGGLSVSLTKPAIACLDADLFVNAFVLARPPHSVCSLQAATPLSASVVVAVHSRAALDAVIAGANVSVAVQTLSSASLCVAQAATKLAAVAVSSETRRLTSADSEEASSAPWHPLVVVSIPHVRPLAAVEERNFTTACQVWNANASAWDKEICFKDSATSTSQRTVCFCGELGKLEVLVTLEERLDFYALTTDLYRDDAASIMLVVTAAALCWIAVLGSKCGQRADANDGKRLKEKTIKGLNRAKWSELNEHAQNAAVLREDFAAFYARKKREANDSWLLARADPSTTQSIAALSGDNDDEASEAVGGMTDALAAGAEVDPSLVLPNETRALFEASAATSAQYTRVLTCLRLCNAVLILIGVVLVFVGVDFHWVLGHSTSELLLYVFGKALGLVLLVSGGIVIVAGGFGLAVARPSATHVARTLYTSLLLLLLLNQLLFVAGAFKYVEDFASLPSALLSSLTHVWNALSGDVREEVGVAYGCCGFGSVKEQHACPDEALDAEPPRTCATVLVQHARAFFTSTFVYLELLFLVEVVCIVITNVLVRWRRLRLEQLAGAPESSVASGDTSAMRAMLKSQSTVVLLCVLPSLYAVLSGAAVFIVVSGVDMVAQLNVVSNRVVSTLYGTDVGVALIVAGASYLLILLRGIHALAIRDVRGLRWFGALALTFLITSFVLVLFFYGLEANLLLDPTIMKSTKARYLAVDREQLVTLERAMECCGFDANAEGTCIVSESQSIPTCRTTVEQIMASDLAVLNHRASAFIVAQTVVVALSVVLVVRLRRFSGTSSVHPTPTTAVVAPVNEFTTQIDIVIQSTCTTVLVVLIVGATLLGLVVLCAGIDALYELNVLHISYLLQTIDHRIGGQLVVAGVALLLFAGAGLATAWSQSRRFFVVYGVVGLALFVASFGALGVSYRFSTAVVNAEAMDFRLSELWSATTAATKAFTQNAFSCCGFNRVVLSNGTVEYTDKAETPFWTLTSVSTVVHAYTRALSTVGTKKTVTQRSLTETTTVAFTQSVCPPAAAVGCSTVIKTYLAQVTRYTATTCIAVLAFVAIALLCGTVLVVRQGTKPSWTMSWRLQLTRTSVLALSFASVFASLTALFVALDVVGRWAVFTSSLLQLLFADAFGLALLVYAVLALSLNMYSLYAATNAVVHQLFLHCVGRSLFALSLWVAVGFTGFLSHYSADDDWLHQLIAFLDRRWNTLSSRTQHLISLDYECCGFNDPVVVRGQGITFDRPALGFSCPLASSRGCSHVLLAQISASFSWLFGYLLVLAVAESVLTLLSALLLRQLTRVKVQEWFAIASRLRYASGKFRSEARRTHLTLSLLGFYDTKFTRTQRLCSLLCATLTTLAIFSSYFATHGCHRKALKTCEQPDAWGVLGMGVTYGGVAGYAAQCGCRFLFELVRHRCDTETTEVAGARQRKEKVLLFRSLFLRRPAVASPTSTEGRDSSKVGVSTSALSATSLAPSTIDTVHATTEERWYAWLARFVYRLHHIVALALFLVACGVGTLMGLVLVGFGDTLYGVEVDQGPREVLFLSVAIALTSLLAWLAVDMKDRKRTSSLVVFAVVAVASILLMACVLASVYMVHEVVADTTDDNWTVRKTGFSVVERLERAWTNPETATYFRHSVQHNLQCCGFRSANDNAYRPCPTGTPVQVAYEGRSVNGSAVAKEQTEVRDLDGCLSKMLAPFQLVADTVTYVAIGISLAQFNLFATAVFLAYDVHLSKDAKLKLRVYEQRTTTDVRQTFEKVVGLKIAAPARGKILSKMVSSSLDSVGLTIASELATTPLVGQFSQDNEATATPTVSSASRIAALSGATLSPSRRKSLARPSSDHEAVASVPYPASIIYVVFFVCSVWVAAMLYLITVSAMALGTATAWTCIVCWSVGVGVHVFAIEPSVIFVRIVASTLGSWWQHTWLARVVRVGRAVLRIRPDAATAAARYYASLSLYERIRFNAAVRIQRRLLTLATRQRYLQLLRDRRRESHRSLEAQRRLTVERAIDGFTDDEVTAFRVIFEAADVAKLGLVSHTVIAQSTYQLGVHVSPDLVYAFLYALDPAYADLVDLDHFLYGMHCVRVHHHETQRAATQATAATTQAATALKEQFVSSSSRFGPAADPQSKVLVKRQNMLRELKETRDSLGYKLLSKMGKLPPLLTRGKSLKRSVDSGNATTARSVDSVGLPDRSRDKTVAGRFTQMEPSGPEAAPTGAFVMLQNRKLTPKKRALEVALKKKHRDDLSKAGGEGDSDRGNLSPTKPSTTQGAKAMVQGWKMPSPRGWATGARTKTREAIATVVEEDEDAVLEVDAAGQASVSTVVPQAVSTESVAASSLVETPPVRPATATDERTEASAEATEAVAAPTEHTAAATVVLEKDGDEDSLIFDEYAEILAPTPSDPDRKQPVDEHTAVGAELSGEDIATRLEPSPKDDTTSGPPTGVVANTTSLHGKEEDDKKLNDTDANDKKDGDMKDNDKEEDDSEQAEDESKKPKPFGTFMLLNKQVPSAGKSKVLDNILHKHKKETADVATPATVTSDNGDSDTAANVANDTAGAGPARRSPTKTGAKSSLEKALRKNKSATKTPSGSSSGIRKPGPSRRS